MQAGNGGTLDLYPVYTIEQISSKRRAYVFKIHVLIAWRLLDVCSIV